jgi:hypothetical protein
MFSIIKNNLYKIQIAAVLSLLSACGHHVDPHNNFVVLNEQFIGMKIDPLLRNEHPSFLNHRKWTQTELPNGNLMFRAKYQKKLDCDVLYEVDRVTRVIVRSSWEGNRRHCIQNP